MTYVRFALTVLALSAIVSAATLPAGTELQVRLVTEASSDKRSGAAVSAVVIAPVFTNDGQIAIAPGMRLSGESSDAVPFRPAADQASESPAQLRLNFTKLQDSTGHTEAIVTIVTSVDNARETVDATGLIRGISASSTYESQLEKGISKVESRYQGLAGILSGVKGAFVKQVDPSITFKPGVELTLKLTKELHWTSSTPYRAPAAVEPANSIVSLVNAEPFRTVAQNPPNPSDMTNLMFIGSAEQVQTAFQEAGWFAASALSGDSKMETARAIIENRGYNEAPMSVLFLEGHAPDFALQKQNDTFAKRHHIRIWLRPETFQGQQVWVAAATHDISITFSQTSRSFTHGIDPHIDLERAKVVSDLVFTARVRGLSLVDRTGIPPDLSNATGDQLITDRKMAVVQF